MFEKLPLNVARLANACYDQFSKRDLLDDREYPDSALKAQYSLSDEDWVTAHDAAIDQIEKEMGQ